MRGLGAAWVLGCMVAIGCGDDAVSSAAGTDEGSTSAAAATTSTTADEGPPDADTTAADTTTDDTTTTGATPVELPYAGDIRLVRVTANQAVQVELYTDDAEVAPADYNTRLISGRRTLLRGLWSLHAEFEPRELVGRLVVDYPDGTRLVQDYTTMVDGGSGDGGASFQWLLEPEQVVDGMQWRARILEADPTTVAGTVSEPPPVAPLAGPGTIGLHVAPLEMKVRLVPVLHQFEGCEQAPQPNADDVDAMRKQLEQNNALQVATIEVGEPMPYTDPIGTSGTGFSPVLNALAQQREIDQPDPNVYYYGLLDPCDGYPPGLLGQAIGIPPQPTQDLAFQRIATGRWSGSGAAAAETFVHELGHTQGRRHVTCTGGEAGPDTNYPHLNGRIGVWGFGIYDFELRTPTGGRDYMTYCANEWVSDYGWEQTLDVIEVLTSWDSAAPTPAAGSTLALFGAIEPDGTQAWWTGHGAIPESIADSGDRIRYVGPEGTTEVAAWVYTRPHGRTRQVVAPLPADFWATTEVVFAAAGRDPVALDRAEVTELHDR